MWHGMFTDVHFMTYNCLALFPISLIRREVAYIVMMLRRSYRKNDLSHMRTWEKETRRHMNQSASVFLELHLLHFEEELWFFFLLFFNFSFLHFCIILDFPTYMIWQCHFGTFFSITEVEDVSFICSDSAYIWKAKLNVCASSGITTKLGIIRWLYKPYVMMLLNSFWAKTCIFPYQKLRDGQYRNMGYLQKSQYQASLSTST